MSDGGEAEAAAARLEQALERIATLVARPTGAVANPARLADHSPTDHAADASVDAAALAGRIDALIAELRGALAG